MMSRSHLQLSWCPSPRIARTNTLIFLVVAATVAVLGAAVLRLTRSIPITPMPPATDFPRVPSRSAGADHPASWPLAWPRASVPVTAHGRAIRLGVLSADLARATTSRNGWATWGAYYRADPVAVSNSSLYSALSGAYTAELIALVGRTADGAAAANALLVVQARSANGATFSTELAVARRSVRQLDSTYVSLGEWLEVARLAAAAQDVDYFKDPSVRRFADWAPHAPDLGEDSRHVILRVRQLLPRKDALDPALSDALTDAIRVLAR
jgi:hypothetical protein